MAIQAAPEGEREFLLDAAIDLFAKEGYSHLTARHLAKRTGVPVSTINRHFPDTPRLVSALVSRRDNRIAAEAAAAGPHGTYRDALDAAVHAMAVDPVGARLRVTIESDAADPRHPLHDFLHVRSVHEVDAMRAVFERHLADPDPLCVEVLAIIAGLQSRFVRDPDGFDMERHWASIADALFAGIPELRGV